MDYSNIEKLIYIENRIDIFKSSSNPIDVVNDYLSNGWILLAIDSLPNEDKSSKINQYILGFPKSNSSQ